MPADHRLANVAERVLAAIELPETLAAHEAFASEVELRTPVCRNASEARAGCSCAGTRGRGGAARAGADADGGRACTRRAAWGDVRLTEKERYRRLDETMRGLDPAHARVRAARARRRAGPGRGHPRC